MTAIGSSPRRADGLDKVTGYAAYVDDLTREGMWIGSTVRSDVAHGRLKGVGWDGAAPKNAVLVTADAIPGVNGVQLIDDRWPVLATDRVRHIGEAVALVAAPTGVDALRARDAVAVDIEPLDPILDWEEAAKEKPFDSLELACGDVDAVFAKAAHVVEGRYHTGHQEHIYIECQGMIAWWEPSGRLVVVGSMQCPYYVQKALKHTFDLTDDQVRVKPAAVGGGFGGKEDYPSLIAAHAALLAREAKRPVKIIYDRHEDIIGTTKRHPARVDIKSAVDDDGRLTAVDVDFLLDGGAYRTLSPVVLSRAVLHAAGPYRCANVRVRGRVVQTNTAPNAAFRGFGAPQVIYAAERQMDAIGRALDIDPLTIRERNVLDEGDEMPTGQKMDASSAGRACLDEVAKRTNFRKRWRELEAARSSGGEVTKGIGLSLFFHGAGFTGSGERNMASPVTVRLTEDGRVEVLTAMTEMGQGCSMVLPQIAASAAGVDLDGVSFPPPDTSEVPDSGPTVASRTTMVVGGTIARAVSQLRDDVLAWWKQEKGIGGALRVESGAVVGDDAATFADVVKACVAANGAMQRTVHHETPAWQVFDDDAYKGVAYATYGWGAEVVEANVNNDTFEVLPTRATVVCEVGKVIHHNLCVGQIEGGTLQALGWGHLEEMKVEGGRYVNDRLTNYIIPTITDTPKLDVHLLERPWEGGPYGAKGVGELPMDGGAPALVAAIENATGIAAPDIPATPEKLYEWSKADDRG